MKDLARRVWLVTLAALLIFVVYEIIKTALFPHISVITSHVITVLVVAVMTFFVSRYALGRYSQALTEIQRQTGITEETNRLLAGVLATMREAVVIVDSQMQVALYNDAAAPIFKLPAAGAGQPRARARTAIDEALDQEGTSVSRRFIRRGRIESGIPFDRRHSGPCDQCRVPARDGKADPGRVASRNGGPQAPKLSIERRAAWQRSRGWSVL